MKKLLLFSMCAILSISCTKKTYYHYSCVVWTKGDTLSVSYVRRYILSDSLLFVDKGISERNLNYVYLYGQASLPIMQCSGVSDLDIQYIAVNGNIIDSTK